MDLNLIKFHKMKLKAAFILLMSLVFFTGVTAQKKDKKLTIEGTVLNGSQQPIPNAIIMIDDQKTNSLTDANGYYKVKVKPTAARISVFTFVNGTMEDSIKGRSVIDFSFTSKKGQQATESLAPGEEGVNTGYGVVKKKNLATDISKIDGTDQKYASYSNITEMIMREVSGVRLVNGQIIIQGSQDLSGSTPPLYVVDGVPMNGVPDIPPVTVKSIEVLKGASGSMYGTQAYGGVILIKTKMKVN
jgi:TonB-dependent SusC/RagA subfamily outer membrane receptor